MPPPNRDVPTPLYPVCRTRRLDSYLGHCRPMEMDDLPATPAHCIGTVGTMRNFRAASRASSACAKRSVCSACILLRGGEQRTFGPLGARRFHSVNRRRNSFHRVAPATLEHAVLESSDAGIYTLQVHAIPTLRAPRTCGRQKLRQCTSAHGCTPTQLRLYSKYIKCEVGICTVSDWNSNFCNCVMATEQFRLACRPRGRELSRTL